MSDTRPASLPPTRSNESPSEAIRRLKTEVRSIANEQVMALEAALEQVSQLASDIAEGGDLYPVGAAGLAQRLAGDAERQALTLKSIIERDAPRSGAR
jgi:hypothetical protein